MSAHNPWKLATFALGGTILAAAVAGGVVTAYRMGRSQGAASVAAPEMATPEAAAPGAAAPDAAALPGSPAPAAEAQPTRSHPPTPRTSSGDSAARSERAEAAPAPTTTQNVRPASVDVEDCNRYASSTAGTKTQEAVKGGAIGGLLGAALGAAGGAIADGGKGAGKGAAIGGLVGIAGGTLYGINKANQGNARAEAAYRDCMQRRGYTTASSQ